MSISPSCRSGMSQVQMRNGASLPFPPVFAATAPRRQAPDESLGAQRLFVLPALRHMRGSLRAYAARSGLSLSRFEAKSTPVAAHELAVLIKRKATPSKERLVPNRDPWAIANPAPSNANKEWDWPVVCNEHSYKGFVSTF